MVKLKWKVDPAPTGRFRPFQKRSWPYAYYDGDNPAVAIYCVDDYVPADVKSGHHAPLIIRIADYSSGKSFEWIQLKTRGSNLVEAKQIATNFLNKYPQCQHTPR